MSMLSNSSTTVPADDGATSPDVPWWMAGKAAAERCREDESELRSTLQMVDLCDAIQLYCMPFLIVIGVVLNSVNFVAFRSSTLRLYATGVYVCALAVVDSTALASHVPRRWLNALYAAVGWGRRVTPYDTVDVACKTLTLVAGAAQFASAWTTVAMAAERASVAVSPCRVTPLRQAPAARVVVVLLATAAVAVSCHVVVTWHSAGGACQPRSGPVVVVAAMFVAEALAFAVPVALLGALAAVAVRGIVVAGRTDRRRRVGVELAARLRAERRVTVMVVWLAAAHVALAVPRVATWATRAYLAFVPGSCSWDRQRADAADSVAELIFVVNYVIKFVICFVAGRDVIGAE